MPNLRDVRPDDVIAAFEKAGGTSRRGKGDHVNVKMPNGKILTFSANRGAVKIGLLRAMIRKSGISEETFVSLLGRSR
jgi:predicted RNA binding protein YcfA (HicA-like mRNA interferase family)